MATTLNDKKIKEIQNKVSAIFSKTKQKTSEKSKGMKAAKAAKTANAALLKRLLNQKPKPKQRKVKTQSQIKKMALLNNKKRKNKAASIIQSAFRKRKQIY